MTSSDQHRAAPTGAQDFNDYRDSYRQEVEDAISFSGQSLEFFSRAKARHLLELVKRQGADPAELDVLDVGCGVGETDRFLGGKFRTLVGVDISAGLLEAAREQNPGVEYRDYEPGEPLPAESGSFDVSFAICVLHHVPPDDWKGFVAEMARVTRPGGIVVIFEHNPFNPLTRLSVHRCEFDEGVVLLSRRRTRRLLRDQGLEPVAAPYITFFTRPGDFRERVERALGHVPAGAQYYVAARRPSAVPEAA
jgi:SAM-dependent methyltransferase